MRCIDTAIRLCNSDLLRQLLGAEPAVITFAQALTVEVIQIAAQAGFLLGVTCGAVHHPTFAVIAGNALTRQHDFYFIRNAVQQVE
ncbi:hypothetical protein D3C84_1118440 [compost metagenome]